MPKISDILSVDKRAEVNQCVPLIEAARILDCEVADVRLKFAVHGSGMIYTRGLMMDDTPRHRKQLSNIYGEIVVLLHDGTVLCYSPKAKNRNHKEKQRRESYKRQRNEFFAELEQRRRDNETRRMFHDCQTKPSPKRQGKANSHEDIGKYVNKRNRSLRAEQYRESQTKFAVINVDYSVLYNRN